MIRLMNVLFPSTEDISSFFLSFESTFRSCLKSAKEQRGVSVTPQNISKVRHNPHPIGKKMVSKKHDQLSNSQLEADVNSQI